ncbi:MAG: FHA domain-containing protein [Wenzhouxiangellaceae bacterium]|nr:FHA domain-containing protein [Wenzhouxiangellaceae bacterium]
MYRLKAASGEWTGQAFPLEDDTLIGSDAEADVRHDSLEPRHARIVREDDALMLETAGPTWVNGEPVERRPLESGDELRFGTLRFVLQAPGLKPPRVLEETARPSRTWLRWAAIVAVAAGAAAAAWWFLPAAG